jgi:hypothetical protein
MAAEAERIGPLDDRLDGPWGGPEETRVCWCYAQREVAMPASPLGETRTLAPIVRILVTRRDRELLKTPGSRNSHCTVPRGKL